MNQAHRRTRSRVKRGTLIIAALLFVVTAGALNYLRPLPNVAAVTASLGDLQTPALQLTWPASTEAAVGASDYGLLGAHGSETPLPIASIAKVITSLAILEKKPLNPGQQGPNLTIGANDIALYQQYVAEDGSVVPVTLGEQLSERQVLQAMLLPSANNIADSAAIWTFGSISNYVTFANQMLQQLGLTHTVVADDASGFLPHTVSSASDLVRLGQHVMQNPVLADIVSQQAAILPQAGTVHNVDALLGSNGIVGIKTGNTDQAGGCFLLAAHYTPANGKEVTIVTAVVGAADLGSALHESQSFLLSARQNFTAQTFVHAGQVLATYTLPWGGTVQAVVADDITPTLWNGTTVKAVANLAPLKGGTAAGTKVGTLTLSAGNAKSTQDVHLQQTANGPNFWWRLFRRP
ncbi:MAG TPA: D-alanyl-D-alanine carboxypeptidase [Candidatus Saccharimonadales bacterium]|nr:D-alanyl-D-alanine carboxypeptidase [Candidatus Saccharimonadales bacterium]